MRKAIFASYLIVFAASLCSQQAPAPKQDPTTPPPIVRDANSTPADLAVPLCPAVFNDSLDSNGIAASDDTSVTPPRSKSKHTVEFEASDEARHFYASQGRSASLVVGVSLVVDAKGNPQNVCLTKSAGLGLDAKAESGVRQYRFAPASRDGRPVAKRISIEIIFSVD